MWLVGIGGMLGTLSRFLLGKWIMSKMNSTYPFGTWGINISGSFFLGLLAAFHLGNMIPDWMWLLIGTGYLGAFTTFSTFAYETTQMVQKKEIRKAVVYVITSVVLGVLFAWFGFLAGGVTQ